MKEFIKKSFYPSVVMFFVLLILRIATMLICVDYSTGFVKQNNAVGAVLAVCIVISAVFYIVNALVGAKLDAPEYTNNKKMQPAFFIMMTGFGAATLETLFQIQSATVFFDILLVILGIMSVCFFYLLAAAGNTKASNGYFALSLSPVLYFTILLLYKYLEFTKYPSQVSRTFEIIMICGFLAFFLQLSKALNNRGNVYCLYSYSALATAFSMVSIVAEVVGAEIIYKNRVFSMQLSIWQIIFFLSAALLCLSSFLNCRKTLFCSSNE